MPPITSFVTVFTEKSSEITALLRELFEHNVAIDIELCKDDVYTILSVTSTITQEKHNNNIMSALKPLKMESDKHNYQRIPTKERTIPTIVDTKGVCQEPVIDVVSSVLNENLPPYNGIAFSRQISDESSQWWESALKCNSVATSKSIASLTPNGIASLTPNRVASPTLQLPADNNGSYFVEPLPSVFGQLMQPSVGEATFQRVRQSLYVEPTTEFKGARAIGLQTRIPFETELTATNSLRSSLDSLPSKSGYTTENESIDSDCETKHVSKRKQAEFKPITSKFKNVSSISVKNARVDECCDKIEEVFKQEKIKVVIRCDDNGESYTFINILSNIDGYKKHDECVKQSMNLLKLDVAKYIKTAENHHKTKLQGKTT